MSRFLVLGGVAVMAAALFTARLPAQHFGGHRGGHGGFGHDGGHGGHDDFGGHHDHEEHFGHHHDHDEHFDHHDDVPRGFREIHYHGELPPVLRHKPVIIEVKKPGRPVQRIVVVAGKNGKVFARNIGQGGGSAVGSQGGAPEAVGTAVAKKSVGGGSNAVPGFANKTVVKATLVTAQKTVVKKAAVTKTAVAADAGAPDAGAAQAAPAVAATKEAAPAAVAKTEATPAAATETVAAKDTTVAVADTKDAVAATDEKTVAVAADPKGLTEVKDKLVGLWQSTRADIAGRDTVMQLNVETDGVATLRIQTRGEEPFSVKLPLAMDKNVIMMTDGSQKLELGELASSDTDRFELKRDGQLLTFNRM